MIVYLIMNEPLEMVAAAACAVVLVSCILLVNHMPRGWRRLPDKLLLVWIAIGALGGAVGPLDGIYIQPTWAEILMYTGIAVFSMWLTWPFWRELPMFDRRRPLPVDEVETLDRRSA